MSILNRTRHESYPNSPYGLEVRRREELETLEAWARAIIFKKFFDGVPITREKREILDRLEEARKAKPIFEPTPMRSGFRHKRMYGTFKHRFVGYGRSAFWRRECVCGEVIVFK